MPSRTRHPLFDNRTRRDCDDEILSAGAGSAIPNFVDRIMGFAKKADEASEGSE